MEISKAIEERLLGLVESGQFSSVDEVLLRALAALQNQMGVDARLETLLLEGLEGEDEDWTAKDWEDVRHELRLQQESRVKSGSAHR